MADRAFINQTVRLTKEVTPGTNPGTGFQKLRGLAGTYGADGDFKTFKGIGQKYPSVGALNKEWGSLELKGQPTYAELSYILCGIFANVSPVLTGTLVNTWTFSPATDTKDTIATYSIEAGETGEVEKMTFGHFADFSLKADREGGLDASATVVGQALDVTAANTFGTAAATGLSMVPILPTDLNVYLDTTSGGIGGTQLTRSFVTDFKLANRQAGIYAFNRAQKSFSGIVESDPTFEFNLMVMASNTASQGGKVLFPKMRAATKMYVRLEFISPTLIENVTGTDHFHKFQLDAAILLGVPKKFENRNGVFAMSWPCTVAHDSAWGGGKAFTATLVNDLASL